MTTKPGADMIDVAPGTNGNGTRSTQPDMQQREALERYQTASSVVIPREVFESMYLSPYTKTRGHLRSTFANPTPM